MFTMNMPRTFWSEATQIAIYLVNKISSHVLSYKSPLEVLSPNSHLFSLPLKTFGCIYYMCVPKTDHSKLDPKALKCVFMRYRVDQKGYKCYYPPTHRKFVSKDVTFFESIHFFSSGWTSLQGEHFDGSEELSSIPPPICSHISF